MHKKRILQTLQISSFFCNKANLNLINYLTRHYFAKKQDMTVVMSCRNPYRLLAVNNSIAHLFEPLLYSIAAAAHIMPCYGKALHHCRFGIGTLKVAHR